MNDFLTCHGYAALFGLSFLASTLLPLGSEWLLVALLLKGYDPVLAVTTATTGNTLGACTTYAVGLFGGRWLVEQLLRLDARKLQRAEDFYARYGSWSLLLSWVPVVGDPLCAVGGLLRVGAARFLLLVCTGKVLRYIGVAWVALATQPS